MIYERPKNEIFASDAKTGEIVEFPNIKRGWGVTENLGFIPPMEYFNAAFNRVDKSLAYQLQRGIGEWSVEEEYPAGAVSVFNSKLYQAKATNTNKKPPDNKDAWDAIASETWSEQTFLKKTATAADSEKLGGLAADKYALKSEASDGLKIGSYLLWSSDRTTPAGFLPADGRRLQKSEYIELFDVIGYTYGGSGENFNLPKFNDGKFIRATGGNAASLGIAQDDAIRNIQGWLAVMSNDVRQADGAFRMSEVMGYGFNDGTSDPVYKVSFDASNVVPVAPENRPYNMSVIILIKVKNVFEVTNVDKSPYATEIKAGIVKLKNSITGNLSDTAVSEKAVSDVFSAGFLSSKQENGYTKLPNGIILQWGRVKDIAYDGRKDLTFPISFPNACLNASAAYIADTSFVQASGVMYVANITKTGMTIEYQTVDSDASNFPKRDAFWFAIGY